MKRVMNGLTVALVLLIGLTGEAAAEGGLLPGNPANVAESFNAATRRLDIDQYMLRTTCSTGVRRVCNYTLSGNLSVIAASTIGEPDNLSEVTLIFARGSNGADLFLAMAIFMAIYSPETTRAERGEAVLALSEDITDENSKNSVTLDDISYTTQNFGIVGIWFMIAAN